MLAWYQSTMLLKNPLPSPTSILRVLPVGWRTPASMTVWITLMVNSPIV